MLLLGALGLQSGGEQRGPLCGLLLGEQGQEERWTLFLVARELQL